MEFNIISPETNEPEYGEENPQMYDKINNQTNMINENIIEEEMINFKSQNYFLFLENNKENKYCLNLFHDTDYYYFKIQKHEPINISLSFFFSKYDYTTLLGQLKLDSKLFTDFNSIEKELINSLDKKEAYLKNENDKSINIVFKINNEGKELILLKREMNENEKFEKIVDELKELKNVNEDKIDELKKLSKEIEDDTDKKCKEHKDMLDALELQVNQNKADIDNETNEIELLKEEIEKIKQEIKENEDKLQNDKNCVIF